MKKTMGSILLGLIVALGWSMPVFAAQDIALYIDGKSVATEQYIYMGASGDTEGKYYMDVAPQIQGERTYVPLSTITKFLGATASWNNPTITINNKNAEIVLKIGETQATYNGESILLDGVPYLEKGRTMVPLRFILENFGLGVSYKDNRIDISSPPLKINDVTVTALQSEYWMTMGSEILENKTNLCISRMHQVIEHSKNKEVSMPDKYGRLYMIDEPDYYVLVNGYYFMDNDNQAVEKYELYTGLSFGMSTGVYVIRDVLHSKWYSLTPEAYYELQDLKTIGNWVSISNTIV